MLMFEKLVLGQAFQARGDHWFKMEPRKMRDGRTVNAYRGSTHDFWNLRAEDVGCFDDITLVTPGECAITNIPE